MPCAQLFNAIQFGDVDGAKWCLQKGADASRAWEEGTPAQWLSKVAAEQTKNCAFIEIAFVLAEAGAEIDMQQWVRTRKFVKQLIHIEFAFCSCVRSSNGRV